MIPFRRTLPKLILGLLVGLTFVLSIQATRAQTVLNYRLESFAIALDPAFIADTQSRRIVDFLHARLIRLSTTGGYEGEIADDWQWVETESLRIHLRSGLTFATGQAITAGDVVWSICRLLQPGSPNRWAFANVQHTPSDDGKTVKCDGLRAINPLTIEIDVAADPSRLLPALASPFAAIVPNGATLGDYRNVAGAGPYVLDRVAPNAQIELKARPGGPLSPGAHKVVFQLIQDDATAAAAFRIGRLDALEISNPTLHQLLVNSSGGLIVPGRLVNSDVHQVRVLIFNRDRVAEALGLTEAQAQSWVKTFVETLDVDAIASVFSPLLLPMHTSYFPARKEMRRAADSIPAVVANGKLEIVTENDPYSDAIAARVAQPFEGVTVTYVGLEKSVLISRLINRRYEIASITLEALMDHSAYWLAFFNGSPFTLFGTKIDGLNLDGDDNAHRHNAKLIDSQGNWFVLAQESRLVAFQPNVIGESFYATGLVNLATIRIRP